MSEIDRLDQETRGVHLLEKAKKLFQYDLQTLHVFHGEKLYRSMPALTHGPSLVYFSKQFGNVPIIILPIYPKKIMTHQQLIAQWRQNAFDKSKHSEVRAYVFSQIRNWDIYNDLVIRSRIVIYPDNKSGMLFDKDGFNAVRQKLGQEFDPAINAIGEYGISVAGTQFGYSHIYNFEALERHTNLLGFLETVRDKLILTYSYKIGWRYFNLAQQYYVYKEFDVYSPLYRRLSEYEDLARQYYLLPHGYPHSSLI